MLELLESVPPWIIQYGLVLAVGLWAVRYLFVKIVPRVGGDSTKAQLMKCEARLIALTHEHEAQTRLYEEYKKHLHEQLAYLKLDVTDADMDQVGKIKYLLHRAMDAEAELKKKDNLITGFFDHSPFTMLVKDKDSRILMVNKLDEDIWKRPVSEIVGAKVRDRFPEIGNICEANDRRARETMATSEVIHPGVDAAGKEIMIRAVTFPIHENGEYNGLVGTIDIRLSDREKPINGPVLDLVDHLKDT